MDIFRFFSQERAEKNSDIFLAESRQISCGETAVVLKCSHQN